MKKHYLIWTAPLLILMLISTFGCTKATTPSATPTTPKATTTSATSTTTPKPAPSSTSSPTLTTPAAPQVFTANLAGGEPSSIDPNKASWAVERTIISQCFRGLLGFKADLSVEAVAATQIPSVSNGGISADGLTYTFKLRPEVAWSDGKKVIAGDFEYSIKRMLSPEVASEYASFYYDIVGAKEYNGSADKDAATQGKLRDAVGVKALDSGTLQIKLANPRPTFLQIMALWPAYPVREDIIKQFGTKWTEPPNYIGNGPYVLTEWVHQDHFTFKPNTNFWDAAKKPTLTTMTLKIITEANSAVSAYRNNEIQLSNVPPGTEKSIMADPVLSKEILRYNTLTTYAFQFNVTKAPFDNITVRQALSCAVDRSAWINNVRGGVGKVAYSWIPPGMPGFDPNLGKEWDFNVTKAKQLLAQAGFADVSKLPPIKFTYSNTAGNTVIAQFLQGQMKENLGINITLEALESKAATQAINSGNFQWAYFGWGADYPDPDNWFPDLFGTKAGNNHTQYSNPQFDALCTQAKSELDNTKRLQLWDQAQKIIVADAPVIFLNYREQFWLKKPTVSNFQTTGMDGNIPGDQFFYQVNITK